MRFTGPQKTTLLLLAGFALFLFIAEPWVGHLLATARRQGDDSHALGLLRSVLAAMVAAQLVVLALWAALASPPLRTRITTAIVVGTALLFVSAYVRASLRNIPYTESGLGSFLAMLEWIVLFPLLFFPLTLARAKLGWRFTPGTATSPPSQLTGRHFSLLDLCIWTAYIAVTLGLALWILAPTRLWLLGTGPFLTLSLIFNALVGAAFEYPPLAFAIAAWADPRRRTRWIVALLLAWLFILGGTSLWAYYVNVIRARQTGFPFLPMTTTEFLLYYPLRSWVYSCALIGGALASLAILASGGWRLTRIDPRENSVTPPPGSRVEPQETAANPAADSPAASPIPPVAPPPEETPEP